MACDQQTWRSGQRRRHTAASTTASIVHRSQALVDSAATLALDLAALAVRTGRRDYAAAAIHLLDATAAAWLAAETLAEGVM